MAASSNMSFATEMQPIECWPLTASTTPILTTAADTFELLVLVSGCLQLASEQGISTLYGGEALLLNPAQQLQLAVLRPGSLYCMRLTSSCLRQLGLRSGRVVRQQPLMVQESVQRGAEVDILLGIGRRICQPGQLTAAMQQQCISLLRQCVIELWQFNWQQLFRLQPISDPRMAEVQGYFLRQLNQELDLDQLASRLGITSRTIYNLLKAHAGMTPGEYFRLLRLEAVHLELSAPDCRWAVTDVAMEYGFANPGRFAGQYRDYFGELPSETLRRSRLSG